MIRYFLYYLHFFLITLNHLLGLFKFPFISMTMASFLQLSCCPSALFERQRKCMLILCICIMYRQTPFRRTHLNCFSHSFPQDSLELFQSLLSAGFIGPVCHLHDKQQKCNMLYIMTIDRASATRTAHISHHSLLHPIDLPNP